MKLRPTVVWIAVATTALLAAVCTAQPQPGIVFDLPTQMLQARRLAAEVPDPSAIARLEEFRFEPFFQRLAVDACTAAAASPNKTDFCAVDLCEVALSLAQITDQTAPSRPLFANYVLLLLDSSNKLGTGILRGRTVFRGDHLQCHKISYHSPALGRTLHGRYKQVRVTRKFTDWRNTSCSALGTYWGLDFCFPKTCSDSYLTALLHGNDNSPSPTNTTTIDSICGVVDIDHALMKKDTGTYIVAAMMGVIVAICVLAGIVDYGFKEQLKNKPVAKATWFRLFMACSLYTNVVDIFSTSIAKKGGQIGPIHCIRFISICWIAMGHMLSFFVTYGANPLDIIDETTHWSTEVLSNSYFAVDSFFFLSGLLLAFIWFKDYNRSPRQATTPLAWSMFYIHRILRLSPPYYVLILFYTFIFNTQLKEMPVFMPAGPNICHENWWIDLLYLNNYVRHQNQCYLVSWYLSTDLQIYLFTPLLLVPLAFKPLLGVLAAISILGISTIINAVTVFKEWFPPSDYDLGPKDPKHFKGMNDYNILIYNAPYIRCQVYIIGMLVGYLLQNKKTMRINRVLNVVLWAISFALMITVVLGLHHWTLGHVLPRGWNAAYSSLSRIAWGLGLAWLVISCFYGYGGAINSFMSWTIWIPLGRLTYSTYLIHICVVMYFIGMNRGDLIWYSYKDTMASFVIPIVTVTVIIAIFWSACFEVAPGKVEVLLIGSLRRPPTKPAHNVEQPQRAPDPPHLIYEPKTQEPTPNNQGNAQNNGTA